MRRWHLSGAMFRLAVEGFGRDRLPYPLRCLAGEPGAGTAREMAGFADRELFDAVSVLLEPWVRVEVHGFYGPGFGKAVRVHAGMVGATATVAVQLPGSRPEYGGDVILSSVAAREAAAVIVGALPRCAPGRVAPVTGRRSALGPITRAPDPYAEAVETITRRPRSGLGEVSVHRGGAIDSRPTADGSGFHWLDYLPADGRYLLHNHDRDEFTLVPGTSEDILRRLRELVGVAHRAAAGAR